MNDKEVIETLEFHLEANKRSIDGLRKSRDHYKEFAEERRQKIFELEKRVAQLESNSVNDRSYLNQQSSIINKLNSELKQKNEQYNELLAVKNNLSDELSKVKQTKPFDIEKEKASTHYYRDICKSYQETLTEKNELIKNMDFKIGVLKLDNSELESQLEDKEQTIERLQGLILNMKQFAQEIVNG